MKTTSFFGSLRNNIDYRYFYKAAPKLLIIKFAEHFIYHLSD